MFVPIRRPPLQPPPSPPPPERVPHASHLFFEPLGSSDECLETKRFATFPAREAPGVIIGELQQLRRIFMGERR